MLIHCNNIRWFQYMYCRVMVFNATFNNISVISWRSILLVEETGVSIENHRPAASHWQTLSHNVVSSTSRLSGIQTCNVSGDRHWLHRFVKKVVVNPTTIQSRPRRPTQALCQGMDWFIKFNTTINNNSVISWWSVLWMEETGVPVENNRPAASH